NIAGEVRGEARNLVADKRDVRRKIDEAIRGWGRAKIECIAAQRHGLVIRIAPEIIGARDRSLRLCSADADGKGDYARHRRQYQSRELRTLLKLSRRIGTQPDRGTNTHGLYPPSKSCSSGCLG